MLIPGTIRNGTRLLQVYWVYSGMKMAQHLLDVKHFSQCSPLHKRCAFWHSRKIASFSPYREINSLTNAIPEILWDLPWKWPPTPHPSRPPSSMCFIYTSAHNFWSKHCHPCLFFCYPMLVAMWNKCLEKQNVVNVKTNNLCSMRPLWLSKVLISK